MSKTTQSFEELVTESVNEVQEEARHAGEHGGVCTTHMQIAAILAAHNKAIAEAQNNALLDLEEWIKLHNLDTEAILDGIEHRVISNLQFPNQPRLDHSARLTAFSSAKEQQCICGYDQTTGQRTSIYCPVHDGGQ